MDHDVLLGHVALAPPLVKRVFSPLSVAVSADLQFADGHTRQNRRSLLAFRYIELKSS